MRGHVRPVAWAPWQLLLVLASLLCCDASSFTPSTNLRTLRALTVVSGYPTYGDPLADPVCNWEDVDKPTNDPSGKCGTAGNDVCGVMEATDRGPPIQCSATSRGFLHSSGHCWRCPAGYFRTILSINGPSACKKAAHAVYSSATVTVATARLATRCIGKGFWASACKQCRRCPSGYARALVPLMPACGSKACKKIVAAHYTQAEYLHPAGCLGVAESFKKAGRCMTCPSGSSRAPYTTTGCRADEPCLGGLVEHRGHCYRKGECGQWGQRRCLPADGLGSSTVCSNDMLVPRQGTCKATWSSAGPPLLQMPGVKCWPGLQDLLAEAPDLMTAGYEGFAARRRSWLSPFSRIAGLSDTACAKRCWVRGWCAAFTWSGSSRHCYLHGGSHAATTSSSTHNYYVKLTDAAEIDASVKAALYARLTLAVQKPALDRTSAESTAVAFFNAFIKHMRIRSLEEAIRMFEEWKAYKEESVSTLQNVFHLGDIPPSFDEGAGAAIANSLMLGVGTISLVAGYLTFLGAATGGAATSLYAAGGGFAFLLGLSTTGVAMSLAVGVLGIVLIAVVVGVMATVHVILAMKAMEAAEALYNQLTVLKKEQVDVVTETTEEELQGHLVMFLGALTNEVLSL